MSRFRPDRLGVGLSAEGFALARRIGGRPPSIVQAGSWDGIGTTATTIDWSLWRQELPDAGPGRACIGIAADLVRWWTVDAPRGTRSLDELRQVAALRFEHLFEQPASDWAIAGEWSASGTSVCCAVPKGLATDLRKAGSGGAWKILEVTPVALRLRERQAAAEEPRSEPWIWASLQLDRATLWWHRRGQTHRVATLAVSREDPWPRIVQEVQRVGSLWPDGAEPAQLHWASAIPVPSPPGAPLRGVEWRAELPSTGGLPLRSADVAAALACA